MVDPRAVAVIIGAGIAGLFALLYQVWSDSPRAIAAPTNPNDRRRRRTLYHYTNEEVNFKGEVHIQYLVIEHMCLSVTCVRDK